VFKKLAPVSLLALAIVLVFANAAFAVGVITNPTTNPFSVPGDGTSANNPQSFDIKATNFAAGAGVRLETCDGLPSTNATWDVTVNCDLGTQTAANSSSGPTATLDFPAADVNFGVHVFRGKSPQTLFNCLAPSQWSNTGAQLNGNAAPANITTIEPNATAGLPTWNNCQVRVASSAADQVFFSMTLPGPIVATAPIPQNQALTVATTSVTPITLTATPDPLHAVTGFQFTALPAGGSVTVGGNPAATLTTYAPNNGVNLNIVFTAPANASVQTLTFQVRDAAFAYGAGGTGTVSITVGTAPVDQVINQQVNGGQLVLSCNSPGSTGYPLLQCPAITLTPAITLNGTQQTTGGPMSSIYVSDNRGDLTANWSLTSYMVSTPSVTGCTTANFCNSTTGANLALTNNHVPATGLSLTPSSCAAFGTNQNPNAAVQAGGAYGGSPISVCTATHPNSTGTFKVDGNFSLNIPASTAAGLYKGTVEYLVS